MTMNYKDTLNLPETSFSMKANLVDKEPGHLARWDKMGLYERMQKKRTSSSKPFVLHDGPPYANGHIHIGHALNKILKDIVVKYKTMQGYRAPFVPGWDCHGLPIEHQVMQVVKKNKETKSILEIRQLCREYAQNFINIQREEFKRLGITGRWDKPYITMDSAYEAAIIDVFGRLVEQGYIRRGLKPVHWCSTCETALAEAEIEYGPHVSEAVYVLMKVKGQLFKEDLKLDPIAKLQLPDPNKDLYVMIWTTTPWTLPANLAIAVHPELPYAVVEVDDQYILMAEALVDKVMGKTGKVHYKVVKQKIRGEDLQGVCYESPCFAYEKNKDWYNTKPDSSFAGLVHRIITADFVSAEDGSGCVHIAPGHGEDDYKVGQEKGLPPFAPVNAQGLLTDQVPDPFVGKHVFKVNEDVIAYLKDKGHLFHQGRIDHSYPHCWRCRKPVIFRATEQWFIDVDHNDLRQQILGAIRRDVQWIPQWGETRISEMVKNRPNWCISRQRAWGVPIPAAYCKACGETVLSKKLIDAVSKAVAKDPHGCDVWFAKEIAELCPDLSCPKCGKNNFRKETDILDVWFDSGASHESVLCRDSDGQFPADLYLEGSDQHRGWFQSSLFLAMAQTGKAPFKTILTHGFIVDGEGRKMSKSLGNVIAPQEVINKYGADVVRLLTASADYSDDIRLSDDIIQQKVDAYRKIRNTCRYILGNTSDFDPSQDKLPYEKLLPIDRWALSRLQHFIEEVTKHYESYQFYRVTMELYHFCTVELSARYFDILKDRLYTAGKKSEARLSAQTVLYDILLAVVKMTAPVLSFTSEEIWEAWTNKGLETESVHLEDWPKARMEWRKEELEATWEHIFAMREHVLKAIEPLRTSKEIGSSLEVGVLVTVPRDVYDVVHIYAADLAMVFIVSDVVLEKGESLNVVVRKLTWPKCVRCWTYSERVGEHSLHSELCHRCLEVVTQA